jgi:hypothetical protein
MVEKLTFRSVDVRAVLVPLRRPVVSKVGRFNEWPLVLIDLHTNEGIVGRSYLAPYLKGSHSRPCCGAARNSGAAGRLSSQSTRIESDWL